MREVDLMETIMAILLGILLGVGALALFLNRAP